MFTTRVKGNKSQIEEKSEKKKKKKPCIKQSKYRMYLGMSRVKISGSGHK
jgi:hypothetical protein